jgi:thiosulfate/3-mercaptopyruvate sulfurtransferase
MFVAPLFLALTLGLAEDKPAYPRADLLVEPADLLKPETLAGARVLDARGKNKYAEGHVPGAVWVDQTTWARTFANNQDVAAWADLIGALGIDRDTHVVIYDENRAKDAARIWFILRYFGIRDVRLVNGGWPAYVAAGGKGNPDDVKPAAVKPKLEAEAARLATKDQMIEWLKGTAPQIVDARAAEEFFGELKTEKRSGAIPGAIRVEWSDLVDKKSGRFKSPDELTKIFKDAGLDVNKPCVTYCQSGGRASVDAFVLELMGAKEVRNYYRSWSEWGNDDDAPIVVPKKK